MNFPVYVKALDVHEIKIQYFIRRRLAKMHQLHPPTPYDYRYLP